MTDPLKKHLTTQLELLDESSFHLQSSISDFVQQIKTRAMGYLDKTSDTNMTMNDLLILVTRAQSTIMEHTYMLMESTKMYPPSVISKEQTTPDSKCLKDRNENISKDSTLATVQEDGKKNIMYITKTCEKLISKHVVLCKLLQQRLLSMDKLIETYNRSYESREENSMKNETLGKDVLKLSLNCQAIANYQKEISTPGFIASQGHYLLNPFGTPNKTQYNVFTFSAVERNVGNHFDPNTGEFTAPVDGLYKASLTVRQRGFRTLNASLLLKSGGEVSTPGIIETRGNYRDYSTTIEVYMKTGDVLCSITSNSHCECTHSSCALLVV
ncbi:uncharacterized protein LOC131947456 [Physella acuta]|uniref:uncharacterized protein LOC131947456 n=1 Tax=Physella acuta TaxID=109671 RepID=UPI0027DE6459|nr:uncharacterized protein LOC131947456 [Physella acuta]